MQDLFQRLRVGKKSGGTSSATEGCEVALVGSVSKRFVTLADHFRSLKLSPAYRNYDFITISLRSLCPVASPFPKAAVTSHLPPLPHFNRPQHLGILSCLKEPGRSAGRIGNGMSQLFELGLSTALTYISLASRLSRSAPAERRMPAMRNPLAESPRLRRPSSKQARRRKLESQISP